MAAGARFSRAVDLSAATTAMMKGSMAGGMSWTQSERSVADTLPAATSGAEYLTTRRPSGRFEKEQAPESAAETLALPSFSLARSSMIALKASWSERTVGSLAYFPPETPSAARRRSMDIAPAVF